MNKTIKNGVSGKNTPNKKGENKMNREIKFRGKRLTDGNWIYGDFFRNRGLSFIASDGIAENPLATWRDYNVDPETVGQFTGLHDTDGKEIYEGDIILEDKDPTIMEIVFRDGIFFASIGNTHGETRFMNCALLSLIHI